MTSSNALWLRILASLVAITAPLALNAGVLTPKEQAFANYLVNDPGQKRNRSAMQVDPTLTNVARAKARDMATRRYFDHITPNGTGPNYNVRAAGFPLPLWWGTSRTDNNVESISAGFENASAAWNALMSSSGHRSHLLAQDSFYKEQTAYGIGYYYDPESPYWHYFVVITAPPRAKSTLTISSPAQGAKIGSSTLGVAGTVGGSDIVASLDIRLENARGVSPWARVSLPGGAGIGNWSASLGNFIPGNNTIRLRSYASGGSLLAETSRTVRWVFTKPLTVAVNGPGRITSGFLGTTEREVGVNYTINAAPLDESSIFSHWSGLPEGVNANSSKLTFTMAEGLSFTANFVPNPFWERRGTYRGVSEGQQSFNTGQIRITVTPSGSFSGRLFYGNAVHIITGKFDASGFATMQIKRPGGSEIGLNLNLDVTAASDRLAASVNEYGMLTQFTSDISIPANESFTAGRFTLRINPDNESTNTPLGNGYAVLTISADGRTKITGTLADGRSFSSSSALTKNGVIPIYSGMFSGAGALVGNATLVNTTTSDIDGTVRYFKPERPADVFYPNAFNSIHTMTGSRYSRPEPGQPAVNFQTSENRGRLVLLQGNIQDQITQRLEIAPDNTVQLQTPAYTGLKISLNAITGRFSGQFVHPLAGIRKFSGIVTQKERSAWGFFLGVDQSGSTHIQPLP